MFKFVYNLLVCGFELLALLAFGLGLYIILRILWAERTDSMPGTWDFTENKQNEGGEK